MGGLRSTINGDLVRSIDLVPGGYGAEYGRGLGGLVRVETRALPQKGVHGYVVGRRARRLGDADRALSASACASASPAATATSTRSSPA